MCIPGTISVLTFCINEALNEQLYLINTYICTSTRFFSSLNPDSHEDVLCINPLISKGKEEMELPSMFQ